ncbi:hypothetical protein IV203_038225 [Nitzschia inconspicua]|uniref:Uncharacterized protein n=1 Tax=Nitzschia inconspicua TaxID=303405 RepID=A0A9K3PYV2_9STRA|nr:hypothetical protein IV203_038225 [Nitzschia inconspicua]
MSWTTTPLTTAPPVRRDGPTWNGERAWSVIVYRRDMEGWKKMVFDPPPSSSNSSNSNNNNKSRYSSQRPKPRKVYSPAIPRQGCIVLPALKQKWTLRNDTDTGTIIRRDEKILLRSKGRARVLMLQFTSLEECLSFADRFVALNPPMHDTSTVTAARNNSGGNPKAVGLATFNAGEDSSSVQGEGGTGGQTAQRQLASSTTLVSPASTMATRVAPPSSVDPDAEQRAVNGMIARLLHDRDFLQFVHKIEKYVLNTEDGSKMLQGLQGRDLSQPPYRQKGRG